MICTQASFHEMGLERGSERQARSGQLSTAAVRSCTYAILTAIVNRTMAGACTVGAGSQDYCWCLCTVVEDSSCVIPGAECLLELAADTAVAVTLKQNEQLLHYPCQLTQKLCNRQSQQWYIYEISYHRTSCPNSIL